MIIVMMMIIIIRIFGAFEGRSAARKSEMEAGRAPPHVYIHICMYVDMYIYIYIYA